MGGDADTLTRRQLLRSAGIATAGLTFAGLLGRTVASSLEHAPVPPRAPKWRSRPDLRIPTLTVLRREQGVTTDPIFIAPYNAPVGQAGAVIVDNDGEAIWENPLAEKVTTNFRVQRYRDSPVLTWWEGSIELGHGVGEYVIADSSYSTVRRVQASADLRGDLHEFVLTPRGTALLTSYIVTDADLSSVGGSRKGSVQDAVFQEVDLATGELLLEWHSLEHVPFEDSYAVVTADWDFFHINSVDLDSDGNLLVSSRSTHTIYKVDRAGKILWRLGGKRSDFEMRPGSSFAWQHDVRRHPSGALTVFDNGATPAVEKLSRGLVLDLDEHAMTATLERQYVHPPILSGSQGSMQLLPGGNVFVGWGEAPHVSEFDSSGRLLFDAVLGHAYESYRAFRLPWSGHPAEAPSIAFDGRPGSRTVYASWNGATDIDRWQLLGGASPERMRLLASVPAHGFESSLRTNAAGPCFAARALDSSGAVLGQTAAMAA
jgi:Arylsulfotransferase (ASST)